MNSLSELVVKWGDNETRTEPFFYKFIGVENPSEFPNIIKTLKDKSNQNTLIFDNNLVFEADFNLISYLKQELTNMNLQSITNNDVRIFDDEDTNTKFLDSLKVVCLGTNAPNKQIDSMIKQIINANVYLKQLNLFNNPKIIYYGNIEDIGWRFLYIAYLMGVDIAYINPQRNEQHIPIGLNIKTVSQKGLHPLESFESIAARGKTINNITSSTLKIEEQIENTLFTDGVYKDWQLNKTHKIVPVKINGNIIDLNLNWRVPMKVREGFKVNTSLQVYSPFYFYEIEGVDSSYKEIIDSTSVNSIVIEKQNQDFVPESINPEIVFTLNSDLTISDNIKNIEGYRFGKYNDEVEDLIISKINEVILNSNQYFKKDFNNTDVVKFVSAVLSMPDRIMHSISGYDFTRNNPKIVVFLAGESQITQSEAYLLAFLASLASDIVVFSPAGMSNLSTFISQDNFNKFRLRDLSYTQIYSIKQKSKSLIDKILEKFA